MNNRQREKDEYLERLWYMKTEQKESIDVLKNAMGENYDPKMVDELLSEELVNLLEGDTKIMLTKKGIECARRIIRAHRIAERLVYDVLGSEFESGACEFEHIVTPELVDSICILLGHPRECPHGMPIPEGECCKRSAKTAGNSVIPLTKLDVGKSARIAYVYCQNERQLHKLDSLQIRSKTLVKLHQIYPTYVIACEGANIALDKEIVDSIFVWRTPNNIFERVEEIPEGHQMEIKKNI